MKKKIRHINKPVFTELTSFINEDNITLNQKKEMVFDIPPMSFESTLDKLLDGTTSYDKNKLADLQVKELWRMFGKHIYGA